LLKKARREENFHPLLYITVGKILRALAHEVEKMYWEYSKAKATDTRRNI
jgi:hypothetical protein